MKVPRLSAQGKRNAVIVLAGMALFTLVFLAASLQNLDLKPAQPFFTLPEQEQPLFDYSQFTDNFKSLTVGEAIMLVAGTVILFVLLLAMLPPEARKRVIQTILRLALLFWVILWALDRFRPGGDMDLGAQGSSVGEVPTPDPVTLPPYSPPDVPDWVTYLVSLVIVVVVGVVGLLLWRLFRPPKRSLGSLANVARSALRDLSAGRDWDDTVIQCYARMSAVLNDKRGIHRQRGMTPSEFAARLEQKGLPSDPVRRLTRLFEKARYGGRESSQEDVNEAVTCLRAILHAVGEGP